MITSGRLRTTTGASVFLVILCAILSILCIYAAFHYFIIMGGSGEVRNAVDAAALNVSKHAIDIKVPSGDFFEDCANSQGQVGITNINRVWGKAFLINANVQAMKTAGQAALNRMAMRLWLMNPPRVSTTSCLLS